MKKRDKIIYWIATLWLSLGMTATGIVQLVKRPEQVEMFTRIGFPAYVMTLLGTLKILGVVAILAPKLPLLKEWAYAGFMFTVIGALYAHISVADPAKEFFGPCLLLVLTCVSWYFRPADRKLVTLSK